MRAGKRQGFGRKRWSKRWLYEKHGLFNNNLVKRDETALDCAGHWSRVVPLALTASELSREIQQPMVVVILGGIVASTFLNMIVIPPLYWNAAEKSSCQNGRLSARIGAGHAYLIALAMASDYTPCVSGSEVSRSLFCALSVPHNPSGRFRR
jgi:hypothetical protein